MDQIQFKQIIQNLSKKRENWINVNVENQFKFDFIFQYSKSSHFITELLQNAEDENATAVKIKLYKDKIEFSHNGDDFDEDDIDGITGIGKTTKSGDFTKVGKFGIGFKSVFAITDEPQIYFDNYGFKIENVVVPRIIENLSPLRTGTKIILPFLKEEVKKREIEIFQRIPLSHEKIFSILKKEIEQLDHHTLLFLSNIHEIELEIDAEKYPLIQKKTEKLRGNAKKITIITDNHHDDWLIFTRPFLFEGQTLKVEIAFKLELNKDGILSITPIHHAKLSVFFITDLETHLKFILQGPYRSTPQRDNIPLEDPDNKKIILETAELIAEAIPLIKELGYLNLDFLRSLPLRPDDFSEEYDAFKPIYQKVKDVLLSDKELIPAYRGGYTNAKKGLLGRGKDLKDFVSDSQIMQLFGKEKWLIDEITENTTPELLEYLRHELKISQVRPETVLEKIDEKFLKLQDDAWIARFYGFLHKTTFSSAEQLCKTKPIIRIETGEHVRAYLKDKLVVYLPSDSKAEIKTVKKTVSQNELAKKFLQDDLEIKEFDLYQEIITYIIPKYIKFFDPLRDEEIFEDCKKISKAYKSYGKEKSKDIISKLRNLKFLLGKANSESNKSLFYPHELYLSSKFTSDKKTEELFKKLGIYEDIVFLDEKYVLLLDKDFLIELGVREIPEYQEILRRYILVQYTERNNSLVKEQNKEHIHFIHHTITAARQSPERGNAIFKEIQNAYFLKTISLFSHGGTWSCPKDTILLPKRMTGSDDIEIFYDKQQGYLIDGDWYNGFTKEIFLEFGCHDTIIVTARLFDTNKFVAIHPYPPTYIRGINGFDPEAKINGLSLVLKNITPAKAIVVWNLLKKYHYLIRGTLQKCSRQSFDGDTTKTEDKISEFGHELLSYAWIPDKKGLFKKPIEIQLSDIKDGFDKESIEAQYLARVLLKPAFDGEILKQFPKDDRELIEIGQNLFPEEKQQLIEIARKLIAQRALPVTPSILTIQKDLQNTISPKLEYSPDLTDKRLNQEKSIVPLSKEINDEEEDHLIAVYPEQLEKKLETSQITTKQKVTSVHEQKDEYSFKIKQFLLSEYDGHCQICNEILRIPGHVNPIFSIYRIIDPRDSPHMQNLEINNLCLCPNCWTALKHDSTKKLESIQELAKNVFARSAHLEPAIERDGRHYYIAKIKLCGKDKELFFTRMHMAKIASILFSSKAQKEPLELYQRDQVETMLVNAYDATKKDSTGWVNISDVGNSLKKLYQDFHLEKTGYDKYSDFIRGYSHIFEISARKGGAGGIYIRKIES